MPVKITAIPQIAIIAPSVWKGAIGFNRLTLPAGFETQMPSQIRSRPAISAPTMRGTEPQSKSGPLRLTGCMYMGAGGGYIATVGGGICIGG